jgi:hypothetical protein
VPRYYKEHARGYDLDEELPFIMIDGEKCQLGSAGSLILVCSTCGEEHFRDAHAINRDHCFKGHGPMGPLKFTDLPKYRAMWEAKGDTIISIEQRRAERLADEKARPWDWQFGEKTEADFPRGYVKESSAAKQ